MEQTGTGDLLSGRYRLGAVVGRGGMGVVWEAHDELLGRDVAVKELVWPPHFTEAERQTAYRRAVREAQLAGRLAHPNVVRIYDIVQEDSHPWIIMELFPYQSLGDLVQAEGPLSPARAARVGLGVLAALRAAHAAGVMHRDVKPANILVGPDGRVVLTDFGIARGVDTPTLATPGALVGSPSYLAPERASGGESSPAGDLWGLGASLYTAVEGHPPFERVDPLATLTAVVSDAPEAAVHAGSLWPVISGLLRKDPAERLDAAAAERMLRAVADVPAPVPAAPELAAPEPAAAAVPGAAAASSLDQLLVAVPPAPPAARPRRSGRMTGALVGLSALAAAVTVLAFALTSSPGSPAALPGEIPPSPSHPATSPGSASTTPGASPTSSAPASATRAASAPASGATASASTASGATAPAHPSASSAPTSGPASGAASAPGSAPAGVPTSPAASGAGGLPAGYYRFTDSTGFSIGVPDGWQISHVGHYVYVTDPANSGIFLLIDQSDTPKPDPLADWQQQAASRAGTYPDYQLLRLVSVSYAPAEKAADWEFTYVRDGIPVHILIRNVLANVHHAYALYWSTPETDWTADYRYFAAFAATFRPVQD